MNEKEISLGGSDSTKLIYRAVFIFDGYQIQGMSKNVNGFKKSIQTIFLPKNKISFAMNNEIPTKCDIRKCVWRFNGKTKKISKNILQLEYELEVIE
jgi:hypothetical protein